MAHAVGLGRDVLLLAICGLVASGCSGCSFDVGDPIDTECLFHDPIWQGIESDNEILQADVTCDEDLTCTSDRRTILRGTKLEYEIRVPPPHATTQLHVASTNEDVLVVTYDRIEDDPCDGAMFLYGTAEFREVGEAALVVYDGEQEVDRYTTTTHEAARLELFLLEGSDNPALEALSVPVGLPIPIVLEVVNEAGEALTGASNPVWELDDYAVARIDDQSTPRGVIILEPVSVGMTTLRVRSSGLSLELPIEVTGALEDDDGGSEDAGE